MKANNCNERLRNIYLVIEICLHSLLHEGVQIFLQSC